MGGRSSIHPSVNHPFIHYPKTNTPSSNPVTQKYKHTSHTKSPPQVNPPPQPSCPKNPPSSRKQPTYLFLPIPFYLTPSPPTAAHPQSPSQSSYQSGASTSDSRSGLYWNGGGSKGYRSRGRGHRRVMGLRRIGLGVGFEVSGGQRAGAGGNGDGREKRREWKAHSQ